MDVIDKYGTDSLRLVSNGSAPGQDVRFSYEKMLHGTSLTRSGTSRILMNNEGLTLEQATAINQEKKLPTRSWKCLNRWILHNLNERSRKVTENFDKFRVGCSWTYPLLAIWAKFADWYVEFDSILYSEAT